MAGVTRSWKTVLAVAAAAVATVVGADALLHAVAPLKPLVEVEDAVATYRDGDPTVLVLGSSHARTFLVVGEELARRTGGAERIVAVPVEMGKLTSYEWVLDHRLHPLMDERDASGRLVRPGLRRVIIVTEWWDSADPEDILTRSNIPARAWQIGDFLADARVNGLTPYNRNYVAYRWLRLTRESTLTQDRGHDGIVNGLKALVRPPDPAALRADRERRLEGWRSMVERGATIELADPQMAAFDRILEDLRQRGLEVTVLLYPRMPATLSETARQTTVKRFSDRMEVLARERGFRLADASTFPLITDDDFEDDFDHITADGNRKFTAWALDNGFSFLMRPLPAPASPAGGAP